MDKDEDDREDEAGAPAPADGTSAAAGEEEAVEEEAADDGPPSKDYRVSRSLIIRGEQELRDPLRIRRLAREQFFPVYGMMALGMVPLFLALLIPLSIPLIFRVLWDGGEGLLAFITSFLFAGVGAVVLAIFSIVVRAFLSRRRDPLSLYHKAPGAYTFCQARMVSASTDAWEGRPPNWVTFLVTNGFGLKMEACFDHSLWKPEALPSGPVDEDGYAALREPVPVWLIYPEADPGNASIAAITYAAAVKVLKDVKPPYDGSC